MLILNLKIKILLNLHLREDYWPLALSEKLVSILSKSHKPEFENNGHFDLALSKMKTFNIMDSYVPFSSK